MDDNENQLKLPEQILASLAVPDSGWSGDLTALPDAAIIEIRNQLKRRLTTDEVDEVVTHLAQAFGHAFEIAKAECVMRHAVSQQSAGSKRPSAKLGVQLRSKLVLLIAELEDETKPEGSDICARILQDPILESLVTIFLEQRMAGKVIDPMRNLTSAAILHLLPVLNLLLVAVDQGVVTGRTKPALNFLAISVVSAMFRASGKIPGRTWDEYAGEEKGIGLTVCRILARALNDALPNEFRQRYSPIMDKPYRKAIELVRVTD